MATGIRASFDRHGLPLLVALAAAQIVGWGSLGFPSVLAPDLAPALGMDLAAVFAGPSAMFAAMAFAAPGLAPAFRRFGAGLVMTAGAAVMALAMASLGFATGPVGYFLGWTALGCGGAASLTTAAHIALTQMRGGEAKAGIATLMVMTGLSGSLFWPLTGTLGAHAGWRATCFVLAGLIAGLCIPVYAWLARSTRPAADHQAALVAGQRPSPRVFLLMTAGIALNSCVSFGFAAIAIQLFATLGLPKAQAIALASAMGVVQVAARALDLAFGKRLNAAQLCRLATVAVVSAMIMLGLFGAGAAVLTAFVIVYGMASGLLAVTRSTLPLLYYDKAAFATATSRIALPLNIIIAAAPPAFAGLLVETGARGVLAASAVFAGLALVALSLLPAPPETAR
ncbi:MFS transporter [Prosthecodimorpha staleyi]|nr:MFS transporter [Prosthecodimorpha staleyi]